MYMFSLVGNNRPALETSLIKNKLSCITLLGFIKIAHWGF